ncbi:uncharacterized protein BDZ83DRAFT_605898 [Colletotrichum acutatum]|uniref:Uncharacterized protein n=1 Tax=Glomerella acutata TaxID=27357 RepID=A0AAD9D0H3_GLOAC|nr:uncharacterized protein BDZ83DRAFT_605898 [Colletotrichum acutatum]KAK1729251.1 hypothetical protein BDZ83DRAFT_605898 [Colletotrichum acutatum]
MAPPLVESCPACRCDCDLRAPERGADRYAGEKGKVSLRPYFPETPSPGVGLLSC